MKTVGKITLFLLLLALTWSCREDPIPQINDDDIDKVKEEAPELTQKVNQFIFDVMDDIYLWSDQLPEIDIKYEFDSKEYFDKLLYTDDKWSYITDNIEEFENSLQGIETTFGYSLSFGWLTDNTIGAIVEFTYPGSPAANAGMVRGDLIYQINNADITIDNYLDLIYDDNITFSTGLLSAEGVEKIKSFSLTAVQMNLNPVQITKVIEHNGNKIGYLFYTQFIDDYNSSLDDAFQFFSNQQITNLVIDLRYNPGGHVSAAQHLCSSVAPLTVVNSKSRLVTYMWNSKWQTYLETSNLSNWLGVNFKNTNSVKLGLDHIHFITGEGSASASELSITGLKPYMNLTTVGETTYGKYTGSLTFKPEEVYEGHPDYYSDFDNWGLQPIVFRYANAMGETDFKDGFTPDISVVDRALDAIPLGEKEEPLLKAAIEDITGSEILAIKSAQKEIPDIHIFDHRFSKFDANKRELIINSKNNNFPIHK